ncbi:MAG: polyhydroxyalkanoate synthesis regulator DNA-binding domain-containing protein [bacterium]
MRIIKRYENRKLYDTESRSYISLESIAALIRQGVEVKVVDNKTDTDITVQTLTQVIFEEGKRGRNPFSTEMLHDIIRWSSHLLDDGLKQVRQNLDHLKSRSLTKFFSHSNSEEIMLLRKRIDSLEELIVKLANQNDGKKGV